MSDAESADEQLAACIEEITRRCLDGDAQPDDLLDAYPQLADELRELLPTVQLLGRWARQPGQETCDSEGNRELGDFRIVRELGRGGMGIVYEAIQLSLSRRVAIKVLPFASMLDPTHLQRFQNEARAAASLKHPHIVDVYGVGCDRAVHYYAMELIDGSDLRAVISDRHDRDAAKPTAVGSQSCADRQADVPTVPVAGLTTKSAATPDFSRTVARIGWQVADALHCAHESGVVHRDIKPANLLLERTGDVRIADFGLARARTADGLTKTGDQIGTLKYMSPEQVEGDVVDHRTDIYSLGATLYELLSGKPVFDAENRQRLAKDILETNPTPLRKLDATIPRDLSTIIHKCLSKEPTHRYATARELADDLQRYQANHPILARKTSWVSKSLRWTRRNKRISIATGVAFALLITLAIAGPFYSLALRRALQNEQRLSNHLALQNNDIRIREAERAIELGNFRLARATLESIPATSRDFEWRVLWQRVLDDSKRTVHSAYVDVMRIALSRDQRLLATATWSGDVMIFDRDSRRRLGQYEGKSKPAVAIAFSPGGDMLFAGGYQQSALLSAPDLNPIHKWPGLSITAANFSPDGKWLVIATSSSDALASDGREQVPSTIQWFESASFREGSIPGKPWISVEIEGPVDQVAFSPDGYVFFASTNCSNALRRWSFPSMEEMPAIAAPEQFIDSFSLHPQNQKLVAIASVTTSQHQQRSTITIHEMDSPVNAKTLYKSDTPVRSLRFSDQGQLAAGFDDGRIATWDAAPAADAFTGLVSVQQLHQSTVYDLQHTQAGTILSCSADGTVKESKWGESALTHDLKGHGSFTGGLEFLDGDRLVSWGYRPNTIRLSRISTGEQINEVGTNDIFVTDVLELPSGEEIAYVGHTLGGIELETEIGIWGLVSNKRRVLAKFLGKSRDLELASTGDRLLAAMTGKLVEVDFEGKSKVLRKIEGSYIPIAIPPSSNRIAIAEMTGRNNCIYILEPTGQVHKTIPVGSDQIWSLCFSSDGRLAAGTGSGRILVWDDWSTADPPRTLLGHARNAYHVRFSPSGTRLASAGLDSTVRLWNVESGNQLLKIGTKETWNYRVEFNRDGSMLGYSGGKGPQTSLIHILKAWDGAASE